MALRFFFFFLFALVACSYLNGTRWPSARRRAGDQSATQNLGPSSSSCDTFRRAIRFSFVRFFCIFFGCPPGAAVWQRRLLMPYPDWCVL